MKHLGLASLTGMLFSILPSPAYATGNMYDAPSASLEGGQVSGSLGLVPVGQTPHDRPASAVQFKRVALQGPCLTPDGSPGRLSMLLRINDDETEVVVDTSCRPLNAALPAMPVTPTRVWAQAPLPIPLIKLNPGERGLCGLQTDITLAEELQPISVDINIDGRRLTVTATPVKVLWDVGDDGSVTKDGGGPIPHASHTYETKGTYRISAQVVYEGTYTGSDVVVPVPIGQSTQTAGVDYQVVEVWAAQTQ